MLDPNCHKPFSDRKFSDHRVPDHRVPDHRVPDPGLEGGAPTPTDHTRLGSRH